MAETEFINLDDDSVAEPESSLLARQPADAGSLWESVADLGEALYDFPLVGLADLTLLERRLGQAVLRPGSMVGILFADVDEVSVFDHTHGYLLRDELLRAVAGRLIGMVGADGLVAYLGDNRFVVLSEALDGIAAIETLSARMRAGLEGVYRLKDGRVSLDPTVGISFAGSGENIPAHMRTVTATITR